VGSAAPEEAEVKGRFWLVAVAGIGFAACGGPSPPPFKPVADVKQLMQAVVDPSADVVWGAAATIFTKDGVEERYPKNKAEWDNVRNHAMILAESGNLLMMVPRAKDGDQWMKMAQGLVDTAVVALRAAESKNVEGLVLVGGEIDEACENCHKKYWPNY
jgi:hypothetical protein